MPGLAEDLRLSMSSTVLLKNMATLQVRLQELQFLLLQGIIQASSKTSLVSFEIDSVTKEIARLVTSTSEMEH